MRILFVGDVFGRPGRRAVAAWLPGFRKEREIDFVIANGENLAGGKGTTPATANELFAAQVDIMTGGNHTFAQREVLPLLDQDSRILRPANLPPGTPGAGFGLFDVGGHEVAVINLLGRAFMAPMDCPFRMARDLVDQALERTPIIIVDFHAEATSEKMAMAAFLDGKATAVIGTHTHVPTADARVTPAGTAAITDVGMSGPYDSVIGVQTKIVLDQLISALPVRHEPAQGGAKVCALLIELDAATGRATRAEAIRAPEFERERTGEPSA